MDPAGRTGCDTFVVDVSGTVWEDDPSEGSIPVLYISEGGVITLEVELRCDENPEG